MKIILKYLAIALIASFVSPSANAYDATQDVNANYESTYSSELTDRKIFDAKIDNTNIIEAGSDKVALKTWEDNRAGIVQEKETFFVDMAYSTCEEPANYVCPPLKTNLAAQGYRTRINSIDLKNGKISCSVFPPVKGANIPLTVRSETALFSKTFENKACIEKYSSAANQDSSEEVKKLIKENGEFLNELKQQEYKYTVDYKKNGDDEFLDLADTIDGLVSFNANIFDFEQTLLTRDLKTRSGFTTLPNETVVTKFKDTFSNFMSLFGIGEYDQNVFDENIENQAKIRDASSVIANSSFYMLLDFWIKANEAIVILAQGLALLFIGYNVVFTWVSPALTNKMQQKDSGENSGHRGIFGFLMIIMFWASDVQTINVEYQSSSEDVVKTQLTVQQTNIQSLIQFLYSETNHWGDVFAEIGIKAYLSSLNASTGLFDESQINAIASEKIVLQKESLALATIEKDMCYANYEVKLIKDKLGDYRKMNLSKGESGEDYYSATSFFKSTDGISSLRANPFPKSEREANAMMYFDKNQQKYDNSSPYNNAWSKYDDGVVKYTALEKFRLADYSPLSLSGCYYNRKKMIDNKSRMGDIDKQFAKFNNPTQKSAKVEYLKVINEIQWSLYAKQGYMSIAYLPATALLIDNIGIVGDLEDRENAIKDGVGVDGGIENLGTDMFKSIAEDIPFLAVLGGYNIAKMVHPVKDWAMDAIIDGATMIAGPIGKALTFAGSKFYSIKDKLSFGKGENQVDIIDLKIAAFLIKNIANTMITVTLIVGSILIFTLLFVEKLFAFISSMFLLLYVFSKNQEERVSTAMAKIFAVAFKTVLIVICIFLSLYTLSLVASLELVFTESFFKSMDMIENASWSYLFTGSDGFSSFGAAWGLITFFFKKYIFFGVTKFAFIALKLVLVLQMIWKMPGYMYELIYEKVHSVSDSVGETLQGMNEKQTMKF